MTCEIIVILSEAEGSSGKAKIKLEKVMKEKTVYILLSTGQEYNNKRKKNLCTFLIVWAALLLASIVGLILVIVLDEGRTAIFTMMGFSGFFLLYCLFWLLAIRNASIFEKKVDMWLEDTVELDAISQSTNYETYTSGASKFDKRPTMRVFFEYDDKKYVRNSKEVRPGLVGDIFHKYNDRPLRILYSPKHDQVLIFKKQNPIIREYI